MTQVDAPHLCPEVVFNQPLADGSCMKQRGLYRYVFNA